MPNIIGGKYKRTKLEVPNKVDYECGENWGDIYD